MTKLQPLHLVFIFLGGLLLLVIVAPLASMVLATSPTSLLNTAQNKAVTDSIV